jgi:hypothetical protein
MAIMDTFLLHAAPMPTIGRAPSPGTDRLLRSARLPMNTGPG